MGKDEILKEFMDTVSQAYKALAEADAELKAAEALLKETEVLLNA